MILLLFHMINQIETTRIHYINDTLIANLIEWYINYYRKK